MLLRRQRPAQREWRGLSLLTAVEMELSISTIRCCRLQMQMLLMVRPVQLQLGPERTPGQLFQALRLAPLQMQSPVPAQLQLQQRPAAELVRLLRPLLMAALAHLPATAVHLLPKRKLHRLH